MSVHCLRCLRLRFCPYNDLSQRSIGPKFQENLVHVVFAESDTAEVGLINGICVYESSTRQSYGVAVPVGPFHARTLGCCPPLDSCLSDIGQTTSVCECHEEEISDISKGCRLCMRMDDHETQLTDDVQRRLDELWSSTLVLSNV